MDIKLSPLSMVLLCIVVCLITFCESSTFILPNNAGHAGIQIKMLNSDLVCCIHKYKLTIHSYVY